MSRDCGCHEHDPKHPVDPLPARHTALDGWVESEQIRVRLDTDRMFGFPGYIVRRPNGELEIWMDKGTRPLVVVAGVDLAPALRAENDRLRAVLEEIADGYERHNPGWWIKKAKAALAQTNEKATKEQR